MQKDQKNEQDCINGYFIAFADEVKELRENNEMKTGRLGVFYRRNELLEELEKHPINKKEAAIVEVSVPKEAIFGKKKGKFGFRNGKDIRIVCLEEFKIQVKEMAVA